MGHHCCSKQKVKRGLWSPEEDDRLATHIINHGHGSWSSVPKLAGLQRCGKSCRLRWINYLRPDLKRGSFTEEEERTIIEVHRILGNRWAQIAKHLPGRTDNEVKNFWNSCIKKKLLAQGFDPNTHNLLQKKSKSKTNASKSANHHRFPSNSSSLVFSDDHDPQTCFPKTDNDTELQNNTINFECNNSASYTQLHNIAPTSDFWSNEFLAMNKSDSISNDVNLCGYTLDENSIWNTSTSLENFVQPMQTTQVIPTQEIIGGANDYDLDASLFNMLSINYGFEDYPASTTILPAAGVYGGEMGYAMDQVAWCEGNNFQCGSFAL
ncbi:transcription repressor MYB6-like [Chenopodium quinoa]|uniref:Uncharacterized protein n=1 Tax=Chenopodium quinoa TaxID=63459 RepID=A0A803MJL1_CHEQI|nr:transcription repressor MYB6-like [Chenopodium quinoa]